MGRGIMNSTLQNYLRFLNGPGKNLLEGPKAFWAPQMVMSNIEGPVWGKKFEGPSKSLDFCKGPF